MPHRALSDKFSAANLLPKTVPATLYADFTCPFSYVTEAAVQRGVQAKNLSVQPRAFELFPVATEVGAPDRIADLPATVRNLAAVEKITLRQPGGRPRTGKAHEAACLAWEKGCGWDMRKRLYEAYFEDGEDIGRIDILVGLGAGLGIDATELKVALDIDQYTGEVRRQQRRARALGIVGVPSFVVKHGEWAGVHAGALSYEQIVEMLPSPETRS